MKKKDVSLGDVVALLQNLSKDMNTRFDSVEQQLITVEKRLTGIECRVASLENRVSAMDFRLERLEERMSDTEKWQQNIDRQLDRMETVLRPSFHRLQITVLDHGTRIRTLEEREGLLETAEESVVE